MVQRHHVGHGTQGHQVQQAAQIRLRVRQQIVVSQVLTQRREHVKHNAHSCRIFAQERATGLIGVHNGIGIWQLFSGQVVVGDNNFDAQLPGSTHAFDGGDAVIDGHQEVRQIPVFLQPVDDAGCQAVAIRESAGHPEINSGHAEHRQTQHGHRGTGSAIGVEVPQHHHPLFLHNGLCQQFNCAINTAKLHGRSQVFQGVLELVVGLHTAGGVQTAKDGGQVLPPARHIGRLGATQDLFRSHAGSGVLPMLGDKALHLGHIVIQHGVTLFPLEQVGHMGRQLRLHAQA